MFAWRVPTLRVRWERYVEENEIPVRVESVYHPLDTDQDWTCCAQNQVRRSHINIGKATGRVLDLEYITVIRGIDVPSPLDAAAAANA